NPGDTLHYSAGSNPTIPTSPQLPDGFIRPGSNSTTPLPGTIPVAYTGIENLEVSAIPAALPGSYTISEGGSLFLTAGDPGAAGHSVTYEWDLNGDGDFGDAAGATPPLTWA